VITVKPDGGCYRLRASTILRGIVVKRKPDPYMSINRNGRRFAIMNVSQCR
jgi:hypothetical protein